MPHLRFLIGGVALAAAFINSARCQTPPPHSSSSQGGKEWALGRELAQNLEKKDGKIDDPAIVGFLQGIENRIALTIGRKPSDIRLTRSSNQYAALLQNGALYISGGLLERIENEAELAGLLAHQLAHAEQNMAGLHWPACVLASQYGPIRWAEERREAELKATAAAVKYLKVAGYEPSAVLDLLSKLAYEHPLWAKAILSEDLLNMRISLENDTPPSEGYLINSSEFIQRHTKVLAALGRPATKTNKTNKTPSLASPEGPFNR